MGSSVARNLTVNFVSMVGAKVGGKLDMTSTKSGGQFVLESTTVGSDLVMRDVQFDNNANLIFLRTDGNLDLLGAELKVLNLTGARIDGVLRLGSFKKQVMWMGQFPKMTLRNASTNGIQDTRSVWLNKQEEVDLELDGFTYKYFVDANFIDEYAWSNDQERGKGPYERSSDWFRNWLSQDSTYSPQPYLYLATVLRTAGHEDKADDILYANREMQRGAFQKLHGEDWIILRSLGYIGLWLWMAIFFGASVGRRLGHSRNGSSSRQEREALRGEIRRLV